MADGKGQEHGFGWKIADHLRRKLVTGLLVVIPLGLTIFILRFLFNLADGFFAPAIRKAAEILLGRDHYIPGLGMIAGVIVLYLTGVVATNILGKRLVELWDRLLARIPLVKSIYASSKQLTEVLSKGSRDTFRRAVWVEFPRQGSFTIAFVTNTVPAVSGKQYYSVFVPTSPNPTSGYVLLLEEDKVYPAAFGVEEAMKIVVSGGMVVPAEIRAEKLQ